MKRVHTPPVGVSGLLCLSIATVGVVLQVFPLAHDPITTRVTWTNEVARIVEARCVSCHSPGGRAPMSLATYGEARPWAKAIKEEVITRRMPKWHAVRGYGEFANDPSLSPFEIALIAAWADGGAPFGDAAREGTREKGEERLRSPWADGTKRGEATAANASREITIPCGDQALPRGTLLAITPALDRGGSVGIVVLLPDGRREIVGWVRNFDPEFATSYWLRTPLVLPGGSRLSAEYRRPPSPESRIPSPGLRIPSPVTRTPTAGDHCTVRLTLAAPQ